MLQTKQKIHQAVDFLIIPYNIFYGHRIRIAFKVGIIVSYSKKVFIMSTINFEQKNTPKQNARKCFFNWYPQAESNR